VPDIEQIADRVRTAFTAREPSALAPLFAPEARWGDCVGAEQIIDWMEGVADQGVEATLVELQSHDDRLVLTIDLRGITSASESPDERRYYQTAFVVDDQIIELQDAADPDNALAARPTAPPPSPLGARTRMIEAATIFPVSDLDAALERYRRLGFIVNVYEGGGYAFVHRGDIELHLGETLDLEPRANLAAVYVIVEDAGALHAEWRVAAVDGELAEVVETEYRMREGSYVDPDGNRIRFGSPHLDE
jgi:hypothetical protein